jgi:hypothetical protein
VDRIGDEAEYGAGRNDLYIANDEHGFCIEAKVACSKLGAPPTGSREKGTDLFTSHRPLLAASCPRPTAALGRRQSQLF